MLYVRTFIESRNTEFVDAVGMLRKNKIIIRKLNISVSLDGPYVRTFIESHNTEFIDAVGMLRKNKIIILKLKRFQYWQFNKKFCSPPPLKYYCYLPPFWNGFFIHRSTDKFTSSQIFFLASDKFSRCLKTGSTQGLN